MNENNKDTNRNQEGQNKEKEKKKKNVNEFEFCKVCNRNHDQGNRHKYFPNHKNSLASFLSRFQSKLADIRFFLENPSLLRPEHSSLSRIWCVFCDSDIDEIGSSFACTNAISHLASADHLKNLKHFLWKYGGEMNQLDTFRILEADVAKWEKKCKALKNEDVSSFRDRSLGLQIGPSNDIRNELDHEIIDDFGNNTLNNPCFVNSNLSNGVMPLQYNTNEYQISYSGLSSVTSGCNSHDAIPSLPVETCAGTCLWNSYDEMGNGNDQPSLPYNSRKCSNHQNNGGYPALIDHSSLEVGCCRFNFVDDMLYQVYQDEKMVKGMSNSQGSQKLTQISAIAPEVFGGNVHTGAPPPWLEEIEEHQLNLHLKPVSSGSNLPGKSHKLNPKRVGAAWAEKRKREMEMEKRGEIVKSDYDANWLPNFGRVWQSGSRKESRKKFAKEKQKAPNVESHSEMLITTQPYISKRMRRDASG